MKAILVLASAAVGAGAVVGLPVSAPAAGAAHPVVVELFQSQGCSSCPPANANVMAIADRPEVLTLSWQVTYWDQLGWKDSFGAAAFTQRQWDYAHALHHDNVFTPQVVVNGRADGVGIRREELDALLRRGDRGLAGPKIGLAADRVSVEGGPGRATVVLVRYDPRILQVPIARGENGGRTLPHRNVVRQFVRLGDWTGGKASFALPPPSASGLKTAVLVQVGAAGPILAAAHS
ncbi:MAG TPA: DUF1223 domain-containing protein [Caulobacteraceae bacterium]|jgi:hypothetical protein|nr:DUF1223 domain-containing protein [Caulobacteraceae bacterium]